MATTVRSVIDQARRLLADTTDTSFSDVDMLAYLNEGQRRFSAETHINQVVVNYTYTNVHYINFSTLAAEGGVDCSEILTIFRVMLIASRTFLPKESLSDMTTCLAADALPTRYSIVGTRIVFNKTASSITFAASHWVSFIPPVLLIANIETDVLVVPGIWSPYIVKYIVYCAHLANRDAGLANGAYQEYLAGVKQAAALTITRAG